MEPNIVGNQKLTEYLERLYGTKLPETEVLEYKHRLVKFFSLLIEIDQRNKKERRESGQKLSDKETDAKAV